ncbi:hypothetical protein ABH930_006695 [Kitasatospora sp. GAS204A]|uniref:HtaA domain-containing protein n=1 Tax=unclassified Kitasatospora TaxID=2633591 RepID=UPI002474C536|nr:HtaA domain-containing protein [Kitasatospora sp. GAS204B]MDH6122329.1 hypothetical protein [Kitasatospora sp. GAS204B]
MPRAPGAIRVITARTAFPCGPPVVAGGMKIFNSKKRVVALSFAAVAVVGAGAVQAGAISIDLPVRGNGKECLVPAAAQALTDQQVTMEPIAPATVTGGCLSYPGSGTVSPNLTGGEMPIQGGVRFTGAGHTLELTNMVIHTRLGEGYTSADLSQDGAPATNITLFKFPVSPSLVTFTPTTVDTRNIPLSLSAPAATAFTNTFGSSPVAAGDTMFTFDGHAEITNAPSFPTLP